MLRTANIDHPKSSLTIERTILANLHAHAAAAARLVGRLDDDALAKLIAKLIANLIAKLIANLIGNHLHVVAHELTEILGDPCSLAARVSSARPTYDDEPTEVELTIPKAVLEKLLNHATSAARLVGHLDDPSVGPLADHIDTIVHHLTELLGDPHTFTGSSAAADDRVVPDGAPLLTAGTGGAR